MEFYEVVKKRRSIRAYKPDPIPEEILLRILETARLAPSAKNIQPWKFIVVKDRVVKEKLVTACRNQTFIGEAPVVICAVALKNIAFGRMGGYWNSYPVDVAIALEHIVLAATNEGLGTCWIGAYDENAVKELLKIPEDVQVIALTPLGYPKEIPNARPRKSLSEIVSFDYFKE
ncbi:MAG: nitroreductase family protein [candidate division WOR-3 bacterium]|nr:nitroreductase family protein [candidate division WOR-3 bacterium]MDW7988021.1 nitroreductase family protein [candidate division WOR-3 bacterium]